MRLDADTSWFTIKLNGSTDFGVYTFNGVEHVHVLYVYHGYLGK
jgi:hypothetical protein